MKKKKYQWRPPPLENKLCPCGLPAVRYVGGYVCARCDALEHRMGDFLPKYFEVRKEEHEYAKEA